MVDPALTARLYHYLIKTKTQGNYKVIGYNADFAKASFTFQTGIPEEEIVACIETR